MKLYLVRHGQTDWNIKKQVQGITDIPLNSTGEAQAEALHQELLKSGIKFDICYASPLQRAQKTAQIILNGTDCEIITEPLIIERNFGQLEQMAVEPHSLGLDVYNIVINTDAYGIETIRDLLARSQKFLDRLKTERNPEDNILIVAHGALLRALTANIVGYDENTDFGEFKYDNCQLREFEI